MRISAFNNTQTRFSPKVQKAQNKNINFEGKTAKKAAAIIATAGISASAIKLGMTPLQVAMIKNDAKSTQETIVEMKTEADEAGKYVEDILDFVDQNYTRTAREQSSVVSDSETGAEYLCSYDKNNTLKITGRDAEGNMSHIIVDGHNIQGYLGVIEGRGECYAKSKVEMTFDEIDNYVKDVRTNFENRESYYEKLEFLDGNRENYYYGITKDSDDTTHYRKYAQVKNDKVTFYSKFTDIDNVNNESYHEKVLTLKDDEPWQFYKNAKTDSDTPEDIAEENIPVWESNE